MARRRGQVGDRHDAPVQRQQPIDVEAQPLDVVGQVDGERARGRGWRRTGRRRREGVGLAQELLLGQYTISSASAWAYSSDFSPAAPSAAATSASAAFWAAADS